MEQRERGSTIRDRGSNKPPRIGKQNPNSQSRHQLAGFVGEVAISELDLQIVRGQV